MRKNDLENMFVKSLYRLCKKLGLLKLCMKKDNSPDLPVDFLSKLIDNSLILGYMIRNVQDIILNFI